MRRFLLQSIESVEQLEVLLLLQRKSDRFWDAAAVAESLGLRAPAAASALEALASRGVLDVRLTDAIRYRFAPATDELRHALGQLAGLWQDHRSAVIEEITTRRRELTDFSEAFRFGKNDA